MVIDPAVQGTVDVALRDVPWDQALDIILRANKLATRRRHHRPHRAARRAYRRRETAAPQAGRRTGAGRQLRVIDQAAQLRARPKTAGAADQERAVGARHGAGRPAHQHADHHRPRQIGFQAPRTLIATLDKRAAAGGDRGAHRADEQDVRAGARRPVGLQRPRRSRRSATPRNLAFPNSGSIGGRGAGGVAGSARGTAVNLPVAGRAERRRPGARLDQRRLQPRRRAVGAREQRQRPAPVDAARLDAEQRRGAKSRKASQIPLFQTVANNTVTVHFKDAALTLKVTPQITASDTVIMQIAVDNRLRLRRLRSTASRRSTPSAPTRPCWSTTVRRRSSAASTRARKPTTNDRTPGLSRMPLLKWLFKRERVRRPELRAADLHHPPHHQRVNWVTAHMRIARRLFAGIALVAAGRVVRRRRPRRALAGAAGDRFAGRVAGRRHGAGTFSGDAAVGRDRPPDVARAVHADGPVPDGVQRFRAGDRCGWCPRTSASRRRRTMPSPSPAIASRSAAPTAATRPASTCRTATTGQ